MIVRYDGQSCISKRYPHNGQDFERETATKTDVVHREDMVVIVYLKQLLNLVSTT
jgi:hypothetical protein